MHTRRIIRAINIYRVVFFRLVGGGGWGGGGENSARDLYVIILGYIKKQKQKTTARPRLVRQSFI